MKRSVMMNLVKAGAMTVALAVVIAPGCNKVETAEEMVEGMVLSASLDGDGQELQTRTTLGAKLDCKSEVLWKTGDIISVNGTKSEAVASADNGKKNVDFTVSGSLSAPYKVLYPGTTSANTIVLPATQSYVDGSFDPAAAASWGNATKYGNNYGVRLTNFCGILRLALNGSGTLDRIEISTLGSEKLRGSFTMTTNSSGFTGAFSGGTAGVLTYNCSGVALGASDKYFHILVPAQNYASGLVATIYRTDGVFMRLRFWKGGHTLANNTLVDFESKTFSQRTEDLLEITSLIAEDGGEPTSERPGVMVGVYNIKMAENRTGTNSTYISMDRSDVQAALGSTIAGMGADIFGINEIGEDNMPGETHDIKAWAIAQGLSSSNYTWKMDYPNKVSRSGNVISGYSYSGEMYYANVFAYNNTTITVEEHGYVWLCNDEDDYWSSMKNAYEHEAGRHTAVYAKCRHKVSGKRFWFIVTHFDTYINNDDGDNLHNVKSFKIFAQHLKSNEEDLPIIAVGDFNFGSKETDKTTDCPNYLELTSYWTDVYDTMYDTHSAAGDLNSWYYKTYNGTQSGSQSSYYYPFISFTKNHPDRRLDHILYKNSSSKHVIPTSYRTIRRTYVAEDDNTWCPSDHLAVVAYMTFD